MQLCVYSKDQMGNVVFHGAKEWPSPQEFLKTCYPKGDCLQVLLTKLPEGFPDKQAYWAGNWGYAPQPEKVKVRGVTLTDGDVTLAKQLGRGKISRGIRIALRVASQLDDLSPYL